jgi:hypothetical protein
MRRARTTAAACATLILLICAWILLALSAPGMARSGTLAGQRQQIDWLLRTSDAVPVSDVRTVAVPPCTAFQPID